MSEARNLPRDFDWVTARNECSARAFFERLRSTAEKNVTTRNEQLQERATLYEFISDDVNLFSVTHSPTADNTAIVRFKFVQDRIRVEGQKIDVTIEGKLTLNDRAECRLKVGDGAELDEWQVLRRALEGLFFHRQ